MRRQAVGMKSKKRWISQSEFGAHVGCGRRQVSDYLARGIIARDERGRVDVDAGRIALLAHLRSTAAGRSAEYGSLDLTAERARLAHEQADAQEIKNSELRSGLIPSIEVEKYLVSLLSGVQTHLRGVPSRAAPLAYAAESAQEAKEIIERLQTEALQEIADALAGDRPTAPGK